MRFITFFASLFLPALLLLSMTVESLAQSTKVSQLGVYEGYYPNTYKGLDYSSVYVPMKDSVRLAVDVLLPKKKPQDLKLPTLVYFVRYVRSIEPKSFFKLLLGQRIFQHVSKAEIEYFTKHGYACVIVDLRGSGASFGHRKMEFSPEEVADMSTIFDWIVNQPWSDGQTATTGISYTGTTAELALSSRHPSLKACIPRSNIFDLYEDMNFPGGIRQTPFVEIWKSTTQALDQGNFSIFGKTAKMAVKGINPVDGDKKRRLLQAALAEHQQNFDVFKGILRVNYRDEVDTEAGAAMDDYSIHHHLDAIRASQVPIYRISGWFDGALTNSVLKGWMNTPNQSRILIGPWDHGPITHVDPYGPSQKVTFNIYAEMLRFLDFHLKDIDNGIDVQAPIHYYQLGNGTWKSATTWAEATGALQPFYFSTQNQLTPTPRPVGTDDLYQIDYSVATPNTARWNSLTTLYQNGPTRYPNRQTMNDKMLIYDATPTEKALTITGHPIVSLYCETDAEELQLFVYLEAVSPTGEVHYITEGIFRAIHRAISPEQRPYQWIGPYHTYNQVDAQPMPIGKAVHLQFMMLPTSFVLKKGYHLRVSIAGSDTEHFHPPQEAPTKLILNNSLSGANKIQLPIVP